MDIDSKRVLYASMLEIHASHDILGNVDKWGGLTDLAREFEGEYSVAEVLAVADELRPLVDDTVRAYHKAIEGVAESMAMSDITH